MVLSEYPTSHRNGFLDNVNFWELQYYSQGSPLMIIRIARTVLLFYFISESSTCLERIAKLIIFDWYMFKSSHFKIRCLVPYKGIYTGFFRITKFCFVCRKRSAIFLFLLEVVDSV